MAAAGPPGASSRGSAAQSAQGRPRMPRAAARPAVPGASYPSAGTGETAVTARRCPEPGPARPAPPSRRRKLTRTTLQTKVRSYARPNHSRRRTPPLLSPPAPYPTETALRRAALLLAPARTASRPPGAPKQREPPGPPGPVARGPRSPHGRVCPADSALLSTRPPARLPSAARPAVEPRRQPQLLFLPNFSPNFQAPAEGVGKSCGAPLPRRPGRGQPPSVRDGGGRRGGEDRGYDPSRGTEAAGRRASASPGGGARGGGRAAEGTRTDASGEVTFIRSVKTRENSIRRIRTQEKKRTRRVKPQENSNKDRA